MKRMRERIEKYKEEIREQFGFCADPSLSTWENCRSYVLQMPITAFQALRMRNKTYHNHCETAPRGVQSILGGLGLKFCVKQPKPSSRKSITTLCDRLESQVRRIAFFRDRDDTDDGNYNPSLYIPSDWKPPQAGEEIEDALATFRRHIQSDSRRFMKPTLSNITPFQGRLCDKLKNNDEMIIIEADKNLGAAIMLREDYIRKGIREHLGNDEVYKRLTKSQVHLEQKRLDYLFAGFKGKHRPFQPNENPATASTTGELSEADYIYLCRAYRQEAKQLARFRMSAKVHKNPMTMRPIVCCAGTRMNRLSKWLDYQLQRLKPSVPTYLKDSHDLLAKLRSLGELPPNARLFTADAVSMYTNIDTSHAISVISNWMDDLELPAGFPLRAVKDAMNLVMRNNIFEWGDTYFRQLRGTAMGTSAACMWATIYYGAHESNALIPTYGHNLPIFLRFIDDIFGIWIGDTAAWQSFKRDVNDFGILTWEIEEPSTSVDFLDLTISITQDGRLTTKTFQKAMNLYQYIPPHSAHPPGMIKGIVYGLLRNYFKQNSSESDYIQMAVLLWRRLVARGWNRTYIKSLILSADSKLRSAESQPSTHTPNNRRPPPTRDRLFLHLEYHPNGMPRREIRRVYDSTCGELLESRLGIKQTTIAYSRPKNVRDILVRAKLHQAPGREASTYFP